MPQNQAFAELYGALFGDLECKWRLNVDSFCSTAATKLLQQSQAVQVIEAGSYLIRALAQLVMRQVLSLDLSSIGRQQSRVSGMLADINPSVFTCSC